MKSGVEIAVAGRAIAVAGRVTTEPTRIGYRRIAFDSPTINGESGL